MRKGERRAGLKTGAVQEALEKRGMEMSGANTKCVGSVKMQSDQMPQMTELNYPRTMQNDGNIKAQK